MKIHIGKDGIEFYEIRTGLVISDEEFWDLLRLLIKDDWRRDIIEQIIEEDAKSTDCDKGEKQ